MPARRRAAPTPRRRPLPSRGSSARSVPKSSARTPGAVNQALTGLAAAGGGFLGNAIMPGIGGKVGSMLGYGAARLVSKLSGHGDYKVSSNTVFNGQVPEFTDSGNVEFSFREFLGDVSGSTAFTKQFDIPINPGLSTSFPWLASMAANYEQYDVLGLVYEYKATSADALNSTNTALGTVIMTTQYDVQASSFVTKQQAEDYKFACSTKPSASCLHPVECAPGDAITRNKFLRAAGVPAGYDAHLYDHANFRLYTVGMQAAAVIGELWCTYHVRLKNAKLSASLAIGQGEVVHGSTTDVECQPFGTSGTGVVTGFTYFSVTNGTTLTCVIPGVYQIVMECTGTPVTGEFNSLPTTGSTATVVNGATLFDLSVSKIWKRWYVTATAGQTFIVVPVGTGTLATMDCWTNINSWATTLITSGH